MVDGVLVLVLIRIRSLVLVLVRRRAVSHGTILHPSHLLLVRELPRVKLTRVGQEGRVVHHGSGRVGIVHMREAVSIVVGDGVVHPGAHGDGPDRLRATALAISRHTARNPLKGAGTDDDGAVSRPRRVVMDRSSRVAGWWRIVCGVRCVCGVGWEMSRQDGGSLQGQSQKARRRPTSRSRRETVDQTLGSGQRAGESST